MPGKIFGITPLSSEALNMNWTVILRTIVDRIELDYQERDLSEPDISIIASLRALRVLLEAHEPLGQTYCFRREDLERWKQKIESNFQKTTRKIPIKFREGFIGAVAADLQFLQGLVSKRGY